MARQFQRRSWILRKRNVDRAVMNSKHLSLDSFKRRGCFCLEPSNKDVATSIPEMEFQLDDSVTGKVTAG